MCYLSSPGAHSLCRFTGESVLSLLFLGVAASMESQCSACCQQCFLGLLPALNTQCSVDAVSGVAVVQQKMPVAEMRILSGADSAVSVQLTEQCQHRVCCRCHCVLVLKRNALCEGVMREAGWIFWLAGLCPSLSNAGPPAQRAVAQHTAQCSCHKHSTGYEHARLMPFPCPGLEGCELFC